MKVITIKNTFAVSTIVIGILIRFILHRYFGVVGFEATTAFSLNTPFSNFLYGMTVPLIAMIFIGVCISRKTSYRLFSFADIKAFAKSVIPIVYQKEISLVYLQR